MAAIAPPMPRVWRHVGQVSPAYVTLFLVAAGAWALMLGEHNHAGDADTITGGDMGQMGPMPAQQLDLLAVVVGSGLMVPAMMSLGAAPMAQFVRSRTLRRRWWATPTVVASYLAVWLVLIAVLTYLAADWQPGRSVIVVMLVGATAWQLTPYKRWAIEAHLRTRTLALRGLDATGSELVFGAHQGAICVSSNWLIMLPTVLGVGPILPLMGVGTAIMTLERLSSRPNRARRLGAVVLAATAIAVALA